MFEQIRSLMLARGDSVHGDDLDQVDRYAQLVNEQLSAMNNAWFDLQDAAEGDSQQEKLNALSKEIANVLCAVTAFGFSFGFPMGAVVEQAIQTRDALESPMFEA